MTGKLPERLFVARVAPHKPVGASTLAHLFVDLMQSAGIDTKTFKSHSVRGASLAKEKEKGASLKTLVKLGDWAGSSTYKRFYAQPIADSSESD